MRLVRYGRLGAEKPGVIGADGKLRALASVIDDITPEVLAPASLRDDVAATHRRAAERYRTAVAPAPAPAPAGVPGTSR